MKRFLAMLMMSLLSISVVLGQENQGSNKPEAEILQMEKQWRDARAKTDREAFERLTADDFITFAPQNQAAEKSAFVKGYRAPNLEAIESGDIKVRIYGDTAVVTGWNIRKWRLLDRETSPQERFTNVWVKRSGQWRIVSSHWEMRKEGPKPNSGDMPKLEDSRLETISALACNQEVSLKSLKSDTQTVIKFTNSTSEPVIVHWLNYEGKRDQNGYQWSRLAAGQSGIRHTFLTHPFLVTDQSGKCLGIFRPAGKPGQVIIK